MHNVLIAGAGKIGSFIACLLADTGEYNVYLADIKFSGADVAHLQARFNNINFIELDVQDKTATRNFLQSHPMVAIISSLPYYCNIGVAELAREYKTHYFDLTEDVKVTQAVRQIAQGASTAFVPQCGLAPGFIGIVANSLIHHFDSVDTVKMRVGALPVKASNALHYSLTWSTDGLINEYDNPCLAIVDSKQIDLQPLEGLETIELNGMLYEAFNTSGGLGSLIDLHVGKIKNMNYKTIRYPGHCEKMQFLMQDLKLNEDRKTLKYILERAIPKTYQDVVVIYVSVIGKRHGELIEESYMNKVFPKEIANIKWSAIQLTTAAGICSVVDTVISNGDSYKGFVYQENFSLEEILQNRFGRYYAQNSNIQEC